MKSEDLFKVIEIHLEKLVHLVNQSHYEIGIEYAKLIRQLLDIHTELDWKEKEKEKEE